MSFRVVERFPRHTSVLLSSKANRLTVFNLRKVIITNSKCITYAHTKHCRIYNSEMRHQQCSVAAEQNRQTAQCCFTKTVANHLEQENETPPTQATSLSSKGKHAPQGRQFKMLRIFNSSLCAWAMCPGCVITQQSRKARNHANLATVLFSHNTVINPIHNLLYAKSYEHIQK